MSILLEDFDLPSQAVTERLNSLLETDPTFSISEDITIAKVAAGEHGNRQANSSIPLPDSFQVFATVHQAAGSRVKLSPATLSRFTVVQVEPYADDELRSVVHVELERGLSQIVASNELKSEATRAADMIFKLREVIQHQSAGVALANLHKIFRLVEFVCNPAVQLDLQVRVLTGARFLMLGHLDGARDDPSKLSETETFAEQTWWPAYKPGEPMPDRLLRVFREPDKGDCQYPLLLEHSTQAQPGAAHGQRLKLRFLDLAAVPSKEIAEEDIWLAMSKFTCTRTLINNLARVFTANFARSALLLEGPPGVGKTAVVLLAARLLGVQCERINFSSSTTLDQLIGSIIPVCIDGKRVFAWQDGKLVQALKEGKWILLDEVNLAQPEILNGLAPIFDRQRLPGANSWQVPFTGETISLADIRVFATMNPSSIGGGRSKLPRSVRNLFTTILVEGHGEHELAAIFKDSCADMMNKGDITEDLVDQIFKVHNDIREEVHNRTLGRVGGPYEINVRQLMQIKDCIQENATDQRFHLKLCGMSDGSSSDSLRVIGTRKMVELVYAQAFQHHDDQRRVRVYPEQALENLRQAASAGVHVQREHLRCRVCAGGLGIHEQRKPRLQVPSLGAHTGDSAAAGAVGCGCAKQARRAVGGKQCLPQDCACPGASPNHWPRDGDCIHEPGHRHV